MVLQSRLSLILLLSNPVRDNPDTGDAVRQWATRVYWDAYGAEVRKLDQSHRLGEVSTEVHPDRLRAIDGAFGLPKPEVEIDGRVDIGSLGITDPQARIALAGQEDADRNGQLERWIVGYEAGKPGNREFVLEYAGIDRERIENPSDRRAARDVERKVRGDVLYSARISEQGKPPMYAYHGAVDLIHGSAAVAEIFAKPQKDARAALPSSVRLAQAGMPILAAMQKIVEVGDDLAERVPPPIRPVVKGTARLVGVGVGAALAAACSVGPPPGHTLEPSGTSTLIPGRASPTLAPSPSPDAVILGISTQDIAADRLPVYPGESGAIPGEGTSVTRLPVTSDVLEVLSDAGFAPVLGRNDGALSTVWRVDGGFVSVPAVLPELTGEDPRTPGDDLALIAARDSQNVGPTIGNGNPRYATHGEPGLTEYGYATPPPGYESEDVIAKQIAVFPVPNADTFVVTSVVVDPEKTQNNKDTVGTVQAVQLQRQDGGIEITGYAPMLFPGAADVAVSLDHGMPETTIDGKPFRFINWETLPATQAVSSPTAVSTRTEAPPTATPAPTEGAVAEYEPMVIDGKKVPFGILDAKTATDVYVKAAVTMNNDAIQISGILRRGPYDRGDGVLVLDVEIPTANGKIMLHPIVGATTGSTECQSLFALDTLQPDHPYEYLPSNARVGEVVGQQVVVSLYGEPPSTAGKNACPLEAKAHEDILAQGWPNQLESALTGNGSNEVDAPHTSLMIAVH